MKVPIDGIDLEMDDEWSFKNFTNQILGDADLSGKVIYSTLFYSETPNTKIFPDDMTGVTFIKCNLDNIIIPEGNTLIESSNISFKAQDDGRDWILEDGQPVEVL